MKGRRGRGGVFGVAAVALLVVCRWSEASATPTSNNSGHQGWVVYSLWPGQGEGDNETRLKLRLGDDSNPVTPSALPAFTLCFWFRAITFLDASTLVSYAISDDNDDCIRIRLNAQELSIKYRGKLLDVTQELLSVTPLRWHSLCLVVEPDGWAVWVDEEAVKLQETLSPLPLTGLMVLGQDQDEVDGGYTKEQSFVGQMTGLTLWQTALTTQQLLSWATCILPDTPPLLSWNNHQVIPQNNTGGITIQPEGPCSKENEVKRNIFLFTLRLVPNDANAYLDKYGLDFIIPKNDEDVNVISSLITANKEHCEVKVKNEYGAWIGIAYDSQNDIFTDFHGKTLSYEEIDERVEEKRWKPNLIQTNKGQWIQVQSELKQCFIGRQRNKLSVFRLRGLEEENFELLSTAALSYVLASDPGNGIYFHGFKDLHIRKRENYLWCLSGVQLESGICITTIGPPIGRQIWNIRPLNQDISTSSTLTLTLSKCSDEEYTCSDAACIDLRRLCNRKFDCNDRSDEISCATAKIPDGYLHNYPPSEPLPLLAEINILRITKFDLLSMIFHVNLKMTLYWFDSWVTFFHLGHVTRSKVVTADSEGVWRPEVTVINNLEGGDVLYELEVERRGRGKPTEKGFMYAGSENPLVATVTVKSNIYCDYKLHWYPWDEQHCYIKLKVSNVGDRGLKVNESSRVELCPSLLEDYRVVECGLEQVTQPNDTLWLHLHLARRYEYHLWTTFLPTSLLLILGYGTLLLPAQSFNERGTMSLTTLLVFISLYTETSNSLPSTAYLKHIDVWFVFSLTYLSFIISVHLATFPTSPQSNKTTTFTGRRIRCRPVSLSCARPSTGPKDAEERHVIESKDEEGRPTAPERNLKAARLILAPVFFLFVFCYGIMIIYSK